ncbi:hypothetical protein [Nocardioides sp. YIM 152315]|uniref:hypothetical protein n=1 Tax=Nocardioides sp. YIM 152315 TaxID=3031760 RepID=UPI0023DA6382|nr:hypothetical protein [Nocardioides sp. YIM 152315]MDF1606265.1 hypothetical protein [Nocardioides sp. YIM 152315]
MVDFLTDDRAKVLRRLLYVVAGFGVVLVVLGLPLVFGDYVPYGAVVLAIAVVLGVLAGVTLRAVRDRTAAARRLCIATGVATTVLSVLLVPIWVGLLTVITGIGLLVVTVAPERGTR